MVAPEDFLLSKDEVKAKYAGKGSPDYPTHNEGCGCSGCYASWVEWRGGYAAAQSAKPAIDALKEQVRQALHWEDVEDEWTSLIKAAHPTRSGSHDEYGIAMKMVGHRHSKGELVSLVNWLLRDFNKAVEIACAASNDAESALREAGML